VAGVDGLQNYLEKMQPQVMRTLSRKLIGYALGRTVMPSDEPLIEKLMAMGSKATMTQLVTQVVESKQFRYRREEAPGSAVMATAAVHGGRQ